MDSRPQDETDEPQHAGDRQSALARDIATRALLIDGHLDVPYRLHLEPEDLSQRTKGGDFDFPRARQGGLSAAFFAIYVPVARQDGRAWAFADTLLDEFEAFVAKYSEDCSKALSTTEVRSVASQGRVALPLGLENAAAFEGSLVGLEHFYRRGIRYVTLCHGDNNEVCDSSYAASYQWHGLSPFGRELVPAMNRMGMIIDVSHVSDRAFDEVAELTETPVLATHSSCRHFTPGWERNLDDDRIRRLAATGGTLGVNFGSAFLTAPSNAQKRRWMEVLKRYASEHDLDVYSPEVREFGSKRFSDEEQVFADVDDVVDHIVHAGSLVGLEHVALGSDYDGLGDTLPTGLKDVSAYPRLIERMLERSLSEAEVEAVVGENFLRAWEAIESYGGPPSGT